MSKKRIMFLCAFFIIITTYAYSALCTSLSIVSDAKIRPIAEIRVTDIKVNNSSSDKGTITYEPDFGINTLTTGFNLPEATDTITYKVTVTNFGSFDYIIYNSEITSSNNPGITYMTSYIENENIETDLSKHIIHGGESFDFNITYTGAASESNVITTFEYRKIFRIIFDLNGGTSNEGIFETGQYKIEGVDLTITDKIPTREGYSFTKWNTSRDGSSNYNFTPSSKMTIEPTNINPNYRNLTLYAQYSRSAFNIIYNLNGGENHVDNPSSYTISDHITLKDASKQGWTFAGWTTNGVTTPTKNLVIEGTGDKTVEAHFTKEITLTQEHGSSTTSQNYILRDNETEHTFTLATSKDSFAGWTFAGWLNSPLPKEQDYLPTATITISENKTVYATYKKHLIATFNDYVNGEANPRQVSGDAYQNNGLGGYDTQYPTAKTPTLSNYSGWTKIGWTKGLVATSSRTYKSNKSFTLTEETAINYYGLYSQKVTLTYDSNGGITTPENQVGTRRVNTYSLIATSNPTFELASPVNKQGYTFIAWTIGAPINGDRNAGDVISPSTNTTITATAKWQVNQIDFSGNETLVATYSASEQTLLNVRADASNGTGFYEYTITGGNTDGYFTLDGKDIIIKAGTPVGEYNIQITARDTVSQSTKYANYKITVSKKKLNPVQISINTAGVVSWDNIENADGYLISIDGINYTPVPQGDSQTTVNYLNEITASSTNPRIVYVKSINNHNDNYEVSEPSSNSVNVYTINLTVNPSGYGTVSPSELIVISGVTTTITNNTITLGDGRIITANPSTGYEFDSWSGVTSTIAQNTTITANFDGAPGTAYTVNHYIQNLNNDYYTLDSTDNLQGETNSEITVNNLKKTINGFTYEEGYLTGNTTKPSSGVVTTTTILADGSRVINLYYRRNKLYIRYNLNGGLLSENHGSNYSYSSSLITNTSNTSPTTFLMGVYGGKVGTSMTQDVGLHDYNDPNNINLVRTGYIALVNSEWNTKADGTGINYDQNLGTYNIDNFGGANLGTGDKVVTLYANWEPTIYNISYNMNGGTAGSNAPTSGTYDSVIQLSKPTKTFIVNIDSNSENADIASDSASIAQIFTGWTGTNINTSTAMYGSTTDNLSLWNSGSTSIGTDNLSLYLKNLNSSSGQVTLTANWEAPLPAKLPKIEKDGYTCGYSETPNGSIQYNSEGNYYTSTTDSNKTLYAKCVVNTYTIEYQLNYGVATGNNPTSYNVEDEKVTVSNPTKSLIFIGNANDTYGSNASTSDIENEIVTISIPTIHSLTFTGWTGSDLATKTLVLQVPTGEAENKTYVANYKVGDNQELTLPTVTRTGYSCGWSTSSNSINMIYESGGTYQKELVSNDQDNRINLYAVCIANRYNVIFDANPPKKLDGTDEVVSGTTPTKEFTYDVSNTLSDNGYTIAGYTFAGWNTKADGTGTSYNNLQNVSNLATSGNTTLYAKWTANTDTAYTVYHYVKDLGATTYSLNKTDNLFGTTESSLTLLNLKRTIEGFTYSTGYLTGGTTRPSSGTVTTTSISGDGSRKIYLYYTRDTHTITLSRSTGISSVSGAGTYEYGAAVTISATPSAGYEFVNWTSGQNVYSTTNEIIINVGTSNLTFTATADLITYSIGYTLNGGSVSQANPTSYYVTTDSFTLHNPTKTGYTFSGWTGSNGTTPSTTVTISSGSTGNKTYTANYAPKQYTLTIDTTGINYTGSTNRTMTYNSTDNNDIGVASKTGETFTGWYDSNNVLVYDSQGHNVAAEGYWSAGYSNGVWKHDGNVTLHAGFSTNTYQVVFNSNAPAGETVTGSMSNQIISYGVSTNLTPNGYSINGYTFVGWNTVSNGSGTAYTNEQSVSNLTPSGTFDLYAQWIVNTVSIGINKDGSTWNNSGMKVKLYSNGVATSFEMTVSNGSSASFTKVPSGEYEIYISKDSNHVNDLINSGVVITVDSESTSDIINYYTLTVNTTHSSVSINGTNINNNSSVILAGGTTSFNDNYSHSISTSAPVGYEFVSNSTIWTLSNNKASIDDDKDYETTIKVIGSSTLTSTSTAKSFTVTYNANGGTVSPSSKTVTYDGTYGPLPTPTRDGYEFGGWFTDNTWTTEIKSTDTVNILSNQIIIARWIPNDYTLTINSNGGYIPVTEGWTLDTNRRNGTKTITYDTAYSNLPEPTRENYDFVGWFTGLTDGVEVTNESLYKVAGNQTLYAHWSGKVYKIDLISTSPYETVPTPTTIYEKYNVGYYLTYSNGEVSNQMTTVSNNITPPIRDDYELGGYYIYNEGNNSDTYKYITSDGYLSSSASNTHFTSNSELYTHWIKDVNSVDMSLTTETIYSGSEKTPSPTLIDNGNNRRTILYKSNDFNVSYETGVERINVGTYNGTITGRNRYNSSSYAYYYGTRNISFDIVNAKLTFDPGDGAISNCANSLVDGKCEIYTRQGETRVFKNKFTLGDETPTEVVSIPTVSKTDYVLEGWYDDNNHKVLDENGDFTGTAVLGYTTSSAWNTQSNKTLYARYIKNNIVVSYKSNIFSTVDQTKNGVTSTYDDSTGYLTLDGTWNSNGFTFNEYVTNMVFAEGDIFDLTLEYVSGSYTSSVNPVFVYDVSKDSDRFNDRATISSKMDTILPLVGSEENSLTINSVSATGNGDLFWMWQSTAGATTFNNYVVKVLFSKRYPTITIPYGSNYSFPQGGHGKLGYSWNGWYTAQNGGTKVTTSTVMNQREDHTLYGRFNKANYTISYNANLFSAKKQTKNGVSSSFDSDLGILTLNGNWSTTGYNFNDIATDVSFVSGDIYDMTLTYVSGSYTGSPIFVYDIAKDGDALATRQNIDVNFPTSSSGPRTNTITINSNGATGNGDKFWMWQSTAGATTFNNYRVKVNFTRRYPTASVTYGDNYQLPTGYGHGKTGYTFDGWYTSESGGDRIKGSTVMNRAYNHTLYAHFTDNNKPVVKLTIYKYDDSKTNKDGAVIMSETSYSSDATIYVSGGSWINHAVTFKFDSSDNSSVESKEWKWNTAGVYTDSGSTYSGGPISHSANPYYQTLTAGGWRKAQYIVTDDSGNKVTLTIVAKIDYEKPKVKVTVYKYNSNNSNNHYIGDTLISETTYTDNATITVSNDWHDYGAVFKLDSSDNATINTKTWRWNSAGDYDGTSSYSNPQQMTGNPEYPNLNGEGFRKAQFTVTDGAGNTITLNFVIKIDRAKPKARVTVYKYDSTKTNNLGDVVKSATDYTSDQEIQINSDWVNYGVMLKIELSDKGAGLKTNKTWQHNAAGNYNDSGNTWSYTKSDLTGTTIYQDINSSGFRRGRITVQDNVNNTLTLTFIHHMDTVNPTLVFDPSTYSSYYVGQWIGVYCSDAGSGLTSSSSYIHDHVGNRTATAQSSAALQFNSVMTNGAVTGTCTDAAGNTVTQDVTYTIVNQPSWHCYKREGESAERCSTNGGTCITGTTSGGNCTCRYCSYY